MSIILEVLNIPLPIILEALKILLRLSIILEALKIPLPSVYYIRGLEDSTLSIILKALKIPLRLSIIFEALTIPLRLSIILEVLKIPPLSVYYIKGFDDSTPACP